MRELDPIERLRRLVSTYPTQRAAADGLGLSPQYVTQLLTGKRAFSETVLARIGLRRAVIERDRQVKPAALENRSTRGRRS